MPRCIPYNDLPSRVKDVQTNHTQHSLNLSRNEAKLADSPKFMVIRALDEYDRVFEVCTVSSLWLVTLGTISKKLSSSKTVDPSYVSYLVVTTSAVLMCSLTTFLHHI